MSLPRYPEYKESGVEWLGQLPAHWRVAPLKRNARLMTERATSKRRAIALENVESWSGRYLETGGEFDGDGVSFEFGDLLFGKLRPYLAKVFLADFSGEAVGDFHVLRPDRILAPRFAQYQMLQREFISIVDGSTFGSKMPRASWEAVGEMSFVVPPTDEQALIASFLDRETAKIDELIVEQEKLLTLLAEKRQATISHAVTRGLDPSASMKDSGIPWLGEIPAHWKVFPLKRDLTFLTSGSRGWAEHYAVEGALFLRIGNLTRNSIDLDLRDIQRVAPPEGSEGERTRVKPGDVLFSITAFLGSVAVVPEDLEAGYVSQHVALARLHVERLLPKWVAYVTLSRIGTTYLASQGYGGTKVQLSLDDIACLPVTAPPLSEQQATLALLEQELKTFESFRTDCETAIGLLRERRSALIAAAVTGKFDLRNVP